MPDIERTRIVARTLARPDVHEAWERNYRQALHERHCDLVFDYLLAVLQPKPDALFLDAGCGPGYHAMRLARRGFRVIGVDFSDSV
jgi:2-polyprenyl-3-methyl-5-hydroxy-6-metoxy-1,4-benzoquinol methylase